MRAFREAVEAHDLDAVVELLAEDVVFTSPVVFKPYTASRNARISAPSCNSSNRCGRE